MTRLSIRGWLALCGVAFLVLGVTGVCAGESGRNPVASSIAGAKSDDPADHKVLVMLRMPPEHFSPDSVYGESYAGGSGRAVRHRMALATARANGLALVDEWAMPLIGVDCYVMAVPLGRSTEEAAAKLSKDPEVEWAEPVRTYRSQSEASAAHAGAKESGAKESGAKVMDNDPLYAVQPDTREWHLDALHRMATGRNVRVAIIDSAIELKHPDLVGQVEIDENFVPGAVPDAEVHGTGVAGIIAAVANNGKGIVGVAPHARLMGLRACRQQPDPSVTLCDSLSLAKALYFAVEHKAEVINMSLSGPTDPLLGKLVDLAQARGITIVAAVDKTLPGGGFPASHLGVVAVIDEALPQSEAPLSSVEPTGSTGLALHIFSAPGRDIPTTQPGGKWFFVTGSSYAAAHVSGLFALVRERTRKAETAQALATAPGSDAIDPCATLMRISTARDGGCAVFAGPGVPGADRRSPGTQDLQPHDLALQARH